MAIVTQVHSSSKYRSISPPVTEDAAGITVRHLPHLASVIKNISVESVARYFGGVGYVPDKKTIDRIQSAIDDLPNLITPKGTYTLYPSSNKHTDNELLLPTGMKLTIPSCCSDSEARFIAATIVTLGDKLEMQCRQLANDGKIYQSTLLDAIGTVALDLCSAEVLNTIEQDSLHLGLRRGHRFAPGLDGYPLQHQRLLFEISDNEYVNVFLNSSALMVPAKSISFFLMLTKKYLPDDKMNKCYSCRMAECQFRAKQ